MNGKPKEPSRILTHPFSEPPEPSPFDIAHLDDIIADRTGRKYDWFSCRLYRLIAKADWKNRERLRLVYPKHVKAVEDWRSG